MHVSLCYAQLSIDCHTTTPGFSQNSCEHSITEEVAHIVAKAAPRIVRSGVVDTETGGSSISDIRTSSGMFFERGEDPVIASEWQSILLMQTQPATSCFRPC